jgi:hypothetical protein
VRFAGAILFAVLGASAMNQMKEMTSSNAGTAIALSSQQAVRSLGGTIPVVVRYSNVGRAPISFEEPAKTWEVHLLIGRAKETEEVALGRIFYHKSGEKEYQTAERAETITLSPGAHYEFTYDPGQRWPEHFAPGTNLLRIKDLTDADKPNFSNVVEIRVAYDKSTFPRLLAILKDEKSTIDSKQFAERWIKRLHSGFDAARGGAFEAQTWWTKHENDPQTIKQMEELNRGAGAH